MNKVTVYGVIGAVIVVVAAFVASNSQIVQGSRFSAAINSAFDTESTPTLKIGAALGLSGDCAEWGESELRAAQMAIDEANTKGGIAGKQIQLVVEDMQCDPKGAVNSIKKLIDVDHVEAIVGLTWGESYSAGHVINNQDKIVAITTSGGIDAILNNGVGIDYTFSTYFPYSYEAKFLTDYIAHIGKKKIAVIHDNDPYGETFAKEFMKNAAADNIAITNKEKFPIGYSDFRTIIAKIKNSTADGVFVSFQAPAQQAEFLKQAHELGLNITIFTPSDMEDYSLLKNYSFAMEGVLYAYPQSPDAYYAFLDAYKARYNSVPGGSGAPSAYDAARVIIAGLQKHYETGIALKDAIETIDMPGTAVERIQFDELHRLKNFIYKIKTIHNGEFEIVQ